MKPLLAGPIRAIFIATLAAILIAQAGMAFHAWGLFEEKLTPELDRKAEAVALSVAAKLDRALAVGIPYDALEGAEEYFGDMRRANPDVAFIALARADGRIDHIDGLSVEAASSLLQAEAISTETWGVSWRHWPESIIGVRQVVSVPVGHDGSSPAFVHVGLNQNFLDSKIAEIHLDILVVLVISLMVALEVMRYILAANLLDPARDIAAQIDRLARGNFTIIIAARGILAGISRSLNAVVLSIHRAVAELLERAGDRRDEMARTLGHLAAAGAAPKQWLARPVSQIRLVIFLFMFGEQLSRPFLPVFARGLLPAETAGGSLWAGLPISAFMLAAALSLQGFARWSDRVGRNRSFLAGALIASLGLAGATLCFGIADFILWRVITALGYALMFVACQGFVIDNTGEHNRARGVASFVSAIMVAELCAPGIGGILADRIGERSVFAVGAAIMVLAAGIGASVMSDQPRAAAPGPAPVAPGFFASIRNLRFAILMLTAAVPAKLALTAFMFYLVPVGLAELGKSQAEIGRYAMLYAVPSILAAQLFARLADRLDCNGLMVGLGGMIAGAGFLPIVFWPDERALLVGIVALGLGQAMSIAPQLALVTQICSDQVARHGAGVVLGPFRLIERLGAALGPIVAGSLTALFGPLESAGILGTVIFVSAVAFSVSFLVLGVRPEEHLDLPAGEPQEAAP